METLILNLRPILLGQTEALTKSFSDIQALASKKRTLNFVLLLLIFGAFSKVLAQQTQLPDLMPNSPNAEAMQQYGTYPVGHYTGVPNISIPLYTITSGDIKVPITLNYHASGIKVAQEASWVGLGWSLSAGGSLSKQKKSYDDFGHYESTNYHFRDPIIELTEDNKNGINLTDSQYEQYFESNRRDLFPDLYFYGFLGFSGQFIFDDFPKGVSVKRGDGLEFNVQNFGTNGSQLDDLEWRVKDLRGTTYSFDQPVVKEISTRDEEIGSNVGFDRTVGSWLLTKIQSTNNNEVSFSYTQSGVIETPRFSSTNSTLKINTTLLDLPPPGLDLVVLDRHLPDIAYGSSVSSVEYIYDFYMDRIDFDGGYVLFDVTDRDDLNSNLSSKKLSGIRVFNDDDELIKGFEFNYTYVNTDSGSINHLYAKLCLTSVQEYNIVNSVRVNKEPHTFTYHQRPSNIAPVAKNSDRTDHWGYWGRPENVSSMIQHSSLDMDAVTHTSNDPPEIISDERHEYGTEFMGNLPIMDTLVAKSISYKVPGHNLFNVGYLRHSVDSTLNKIYSLKSITYPTKGKTEFVLETNRYSNYYPKYKAPGFLATYSGSGPLPLVTSLPGGTEMPVYRYEENKIHLTTYFGNTSTTNGFDGLAKDFTISNTTRVRLDFEMFIANSIGAEGVLKRQDGSEIIVFRPNSTNSFKSVQGVLLPPGNYRVEINTGQFASDFIAEFVNYEQISITDPQTVDAFDYQLGGGLRIKEIKNYDSDDALLKRTIYDYTREGYQFENAVPNQPSPLVTRSSGKLLSPIQYDKVKIHEYESTLEIVGTNGQHTTDKYRILSAGKSFSSSPIIPVATSANGKSIGYDQVSVSQIDSQGNTLGKTVYYFQNQLETVADYGTSIPNEIHLDNGKLLKTENYNTAGVLVSKSEYDYSLDSYQPYMYGLSRSHANSEDILFSQSPCYDALSCRIDWEDVVKYSDYKIKSEWWYLNEKTDTIYDLNGANPIASKTTYVYTPNSKNYKPSQITATTSDLKPIITKKIYPDDIKTATTLQDDSVILGGAISNFSTVQRLLDDDLHRMATSIQTEVYKDEDEDGIADANELLSIKRTNYTQWGLQNFVKPLTVESLKGTYNATTNPLKERVEYHLYNDEGKPVEVSQTDGPHIYYIWGYNKKYPIAKIENFSYADAIAVQSKISDAVNTSNSENDRTMDVIAANGNVSYFGQEGLLRQKLADLRNDPALDDAQITTYTYDLLIGITSVTDTRGYTTYYEYDDFNRLKHVKDANGNILSENEYNYKH